MSSSNSVEMPFLDHLEELRWRLFKSAVAIALGVGVALTGVDEATKERIKDLIRAIAYVDGDDLA